MIYIVATVVKSHLFPEKCDRKAANMGEGAFENPN